MKTLVLGASENPTRYSYIAIQMLQTYHHEVLAVGKREGQVHGIPITTDFPQGEEIDTVTLYLNPQNQERYYDKIIGAKPRRIIFNPGTENETLRKMAEDKGIETDYSCTLVLLSSGQY